MRQPGSTVAGSQGHLCPPCRGHLLPSVGQRDMVLPGGTLAQPGKARCDNCDSHNSPNSWWPHTHQPALGAALPGFDYKFQEVNVQDTDII